MKTLLKIKNLILISEILKNRKNNYTAQKVSIFFVAFFSVLNVYAANHYIRQGATGSANGNDWANAYTSFPSSLIRGDTYYIASGSYPGKIFDTPPSGSVVITIKKAIQSDHGTDIGWKPTYGQGQTIFPGSGVSFLTNYWVFDGMVGKGGNPNQYGFYFTPPNSGSTIRPVEFDGNNIVIRHVAVTCPGPSKNIQQHGFSGLGHSVTVDHTYVNNCSTSYWNQGDDNVISNSYMNSYWSSPEHHGVHVQQVLRPSFFNNIVANCIVQCIEPGGDCTTYMDNGRYYNNVFINVTGTNGVLKGTCNGGIRNTAMYNNTFINLKGPVLFQNNAGQGYGSGNIIANNLLFNSPMLFEQAGGGAISHSHNAFFNSGTITESEKQVGTGDPFVNYVNGDYRLKAPTQAGLVLKNPYTVDINNVIRGADGVWDRGAYEYGSGAINTPSLEPPKNLRVQ